MPNTAEKHPPQMEVENLVSKLETLPTLPSIMYELNRIIGDSFSSAADVTKVMERDQSLTAKVLRLINSAYYAIPGGVTNLQRAIAYLGYDTINQLVLAASVFKILNKENGSRFNLKEFWKHATAVAMTAETLAKWSKHKSPVDCFTAGLLHDLGKVALYQVAPEYLEIIVSHALNEKTTFVQAEKNLDVVSHTDLGGLLAQQWKLPSLIESAIKWHHEVEPRNREAISPDFHLTIDIVYVANSIVHEIAFGHSGHESKIPIDATTLRRIHIESAQVPLIMKDIGRNLMNADDFIRVISG